MAGSNPEKKAMTFDVENMFQQARKTAMDMCRETLENRELESAEETDTRKKLEIHKISDSPRKARKSESSGQETDEDLVGPPVPDGPSTSGQGSSGLRDGEDSDDSGVDEEEILEQTIEQILPISHEVTLAHGGNKPVSALAWDTSGARILSGGYDYNVKFWDFAGMDSSLQAFRTLEPCEGHVVRSLIYTPTGDRVLVCTGSATGKVVTRDGHEVMECLKGDQYIVDMMNTKGHVSQVNDGAWNPRAKDEFITVSMDGTLRFWNIAQAKRHQNKASKIVKLRNPQGKKTVPYCCEFSRDGKYFMAGCDDGSIQIWEGGKSSYVYPKLTNKHAHQSGLPITRLKFSYGGNEILSRSMDCTMKLWDIRKLAEPINVLEDLENLFEMTDCLFSPDDKMVLTGISTRKGQGIGALAFYDKNTFEPIYRMDYPELSVVRAIWHPKINQIAVGLSDGNVRLYYDPVRSDRGALLSVRKPVKRKSSTYMKAERIITPFSLKLYKEDKEITTKKLLRIARENTKKSKKPQPPMDGPGQGGRVSTGGSTLHSFVSRQIAVAQRRDDEDNPREAILAHAGKESYWTKAWGAHAPTLLAETVEDEEVPAEDKDLQPVFKKPKM